MEKRCNPFLNNFKSKEIITFIENENIILNDKKVAETFHNLFSNFVKILDICKNPYLCSGTAQTNPILQSIEKFSKHPSKKNFKNRLCIFFKFESRDKFTKLTKLHSNMKGKYIKRK